VREFRTFSTELYHLADWLEQCGVKTVAMESTGVYWIALYEILEQRGFEVLLVNAHDRHNVRGRKRDVSDCEWLRELHSVGRLRASFRPAAAIVPLRSFLRQRETLVEETTTRINRMHKALTEMNLKLDSVLTDINQTGLRIIRAILGEERNPERLAAHRDHRCHASQAEIVAAATIAPSSCSRSSRTLPPMSSCSNRWPSVMQKSRRCSQASQLSSHRRLLRSHQRAARPALSTVSLVSKSAAPCSNLAVVSTSVR